MKKAYLVYVTQIVRVVAETQEEAMHLAIPIVQERSITLDLSNVYDIAEDVDHPYRPELDDKATLTPADIFSYSFAGYTVLDVIAMAGNDEHDINATEAKTILDQVKEKHPHALDLNVNLMAEFIGLFIDNREKIKS